MAAVAACIALSANAAEECPAPTTATGASRPSPAKKPAADLGDTPIEYEADGLEGTRDGELLLNGDVLIRQGDRTIKTSNARINTETHGFSVDDELEYAAPDMKVSGTSAQIDQAGGATF
jgi:LPS-assembly protein